MSLRASLDDGIRIHTQGRTDKPEQQRRIEAVKALNDHGLQRNAEHAKTMLLRTLRLKKQAADAIVERDNKMSKRTKAALKKRPFTRDAR